jgi:hypothetical protein
MIPQIKGKADYAARLFPDALDFFALVAFGCSVAFTRANVDSDALKISRWAVIQ